MNVSLPDNILKSTKENSPFKWDSKALKYLGVLLMPQLSPIYDQNFPLLLKTVEKVLSNWHSDNFSWFGREAIIKMTVLPILLYLMCTLPGKLPQCLFNYGLFWFLWTHKRPRISFALLTRLKEHGGMLYPTSGTTTWPRISQGS